LLQQCKGEGVLEHAIKTPWKVTASGGNVSRGHSFEACGWQGEGEQAQPIHMEQLMKLSSTQLKQTLSQFDAEVLPDNHPAVPQLNNIFGDHTFFLDTRGLKVLEPAGLPEMETQSGEIVSLADWSDATLTSLRPHEPEMTGVMVMLEPSRH
jgi:hypothetical protein